MIIDLTKPLDSTFSPYANGKYSDPPFRLTQWSSVAQEGFRVCQISMGTQSGTHIDAPAHFLEEGAGLEALLPDHLMGDYFLLNLSCAASLADVAEALKHYREEKILFLRIPENKPAKLSREAMQKILSLPPVLLVLAGEIEVEDSEPFAFHRLIAGAAKFLVEDLDQKEAQNISGNGEIFIFPLRLIGASGSPCRVMVRMQEMRTAVHRWPKKRI